MLLAYLLADPMKRWPVGSIGLANTVVYTYTKYLLIFIYFSLEGNVHNQFLTNTGNRNIRPLLQKKQKESKQRSYLELPIKTSLVAFLFRGQLVDFNS